MKVVKCFNTGKYHLVDDKNENLTQCGREIKQELVGGWGVPIEREKPPKKLCRACSGDRR